MRLRHCLLILALATIPSSAFSQNVTEKVLHSFDDTDGTDPSGLVQGAGGGFYGTTYIGGASSDGSAFVYGPSGKLTTLSSFLEFSSGENPNGLLQGPDGNFYGTTAQAGSSGYGTVFQLTPAGTLSSFYSFGYTADGGDPQTGLMLGSDGNYYGTTMGVGVANGNNIFSLTPAGTLAILYSLQSSTDGGNANTLVQASDGDFYGTSGGGGADGYGTAFRVTTAGAFTLLHTFTNGADGGTPSAALVQGSDGNLYGTTRYGGTYPCLFSFGCGTVFKISAAGVFTTVYEFTGADDGFDPEGGLFAASDGNLYGVAYFGGPLQAGSVFEIDSTGAFKTVYAFQLGQDANNPTYAVIQGNDGNLYGSTREGGTTSLYGTLYEVSFSPALPAPVQLSLSKSQIALGSSATLSWKVLNAYSTTMQQCYAFVQDSAAGAGTWSGKQAGTYSSSMRLFTGTSTITPTAHGNYTYALTCGGQESGFATLTVPGQVSSTALTASPASPSVGQQVDLSATVTGSQTTPTGSVAFSVDGVSLGSAKLNGSGVASLTASSNGIAPGSYPFTATYSGDSTYNASTSKALTVSLAKAPTATSLAVSPNPVTPPASATLTATVSRTASGAKGTPTGSVTFSVDGVTLGSAKLNGSGVATLTASSAGIKPGSYPVNAKYSGDTSDSASTSAAVNVTVQ